MINHKCRFHLFATHNRMQCESVVSKQIPKRFVIIARCSPSVHIRIRGLDVLFFFLSRCREVLLLWHAFHRARCCLLLLAARATREKNGSNENPALIDDSAASKDKRHAYFSFGIIFKNVHFTTCHRLLDCCFRLALSSFLVIAEWFVLLQSSVNTRTHIRV